MPKRQHPELEGYESQPLYTFELKSRRKTRRERLLIGLSSLLIGGSGAAIVHLLWPFNWVQDVFVWIPQSATWPASIDASKGGKPLPDPFELGKFKAMNAAELTQSAKYKEEWVTVSMLWQSAVNHMQTVPQADENYTLAQKKVAEYQRNLQYALSNVQTRKSKAPNTYQFWTLGSDRDLVIEIQGTPTQISRYDSLCQEVLQYGNSYIKLKNGYVTEYNNTDSNLKVLMDVDRASDYSSGRDSWALGASREDVFRVQGSPERINGYETLGVETLFYGNSLIELEGGQVVGYVNVDNNLKVSLEPMATRNAVSQDQRWTLGSSRADVLRMQQQIPTSVHRQNALCEETFRYGESTVLFQHGVVVGYQNNSQNLRVR